MEEENKCPDCDGSGVVKKGNVVQTCMNCLIAGRLNQHSEKLSESKIRF